MNNKLSTMTVAQFLKQFPEACDEGHKFARKHKAMRVVWNKCPNPQWMLWICARLKLTLDNKAMRLFACWCARETPLADGRKVWDLLTDERSRNAVIVAEKFANGEATDKELAAAREAAWEAAREAAWDAAREAAWEAAARAAAWEAAARAAARAAAWAAARAAAWDAAREAAWEAARAAAWEAQAKQLRKVMKNPFA